MRVPTRKPGKMGRYFPVREMSGNFEETGNWGKIIPNSGKLREFHTNVICYF